SKVQIQIQIQDQVSSSSSITTAYFWNWSTRILSQIRKFLNLGMLKDNKTRNLVLGLIFDALGMVSFMIPGIGEYTDIIWAPLSGWLMTRMYKGKAGKVAGIINFVEELVPGLDIIPSFTLMWLYTYVLGSDRKKSVIG